MLYRNNSVRLGCWLHHCMLRNSLAGSKCAESLLYEAERTTAYLLALVPKILGGGNLATVRFRQSETTFCVLD